MDAPTLSGNLTGVSFRPADAKEAAYNLRGGDMVRLERDPENPHDSNAIKVIFSDGLIEHFVGFVERGVASRLARWLDEGYEYEGQVIQLMESKMTPCCIDFSPTGAMVAIDEPSDEEFLGEENFDENGDWAKDD